MLSNSRRSSTPVDANPALSGLVIAPGALVAPPRRGDTARTDGSAPTPDADGRRMPERRHAADGPPTAAPPTRRPSTAVCSGSPAASCCSSYSSACSSSAPACPRCSGRAPTPTPTRRRRTPTPTPTPTVAPRSQARPLPASTRGISSAAASASIPYAGPWAETFTVVDCAAPHAAQLVYRGSFGGDATTAFPGEEALASQINLLCSAPGVIDLNAAGRLPRPAAAGQLPGDRGAVDQRRSATTTASSRARAASPSRRASPDRVRRPDP